MIFSFARGIFSTLHGAISTGLDVLTGIAPKPRDIMNQERQEKVRAREEKSRKAANQAARREEQRRWEEMHGIRQRGRRKGYSHRQR